MITRRTLLKGMAAASASLRLKGVARAQSNEIAPGAFQPTWESLKQWRMPEWFRDAKFGMWAHWSAQCVPEQGDWYARHMYIQGMPQYDFHVKTYGHPSKVGFKEIDHMWKAERWQPEQLLDLYVGAGAKYFVSLAVHHDNLDCWDSKYHSWNSVRVGPGKDIVGTWARLARARGLRFGVSNHSAHAWHWLQTAYGYDPEGPMAGVRYDAYTLKSSDGKGRWWDGLDPQELYTGRNMVIPDGLTTIKEAQAWHDANDRKWTELPPPNNPEFVRTWYLRCKDLVDKYQPDMLYFDDTELPLGQAGLDITAHYYNSNAARHGGQTEAVVAAKNLSPQHIGATMLDIERGRAQTILEAPWQTDTCIGDWHYKRSIFEQHQYKTAETVAQTLVDIVSKNGNLLLNIPLRGDGSIDEDEHAFLIDLARWMTVHGEGIYGTRPFKVYGEGAPDVSTSGDFNESKARPYDANDLRFTQKGNVIYIFMLGWPADGMLRVKSFARGSSVYPGEIHEIQMLGASGKLRFKRDQNALAAKLPPKPENHLNAFGFKVLS
jgi:alpha-L-fucosidase